MTCPFCQSPDAEVKPTGTGGGRIGVTCPKCGRYDLSGSAEAIATADGAFTNEARKWLPYTLRLKQVGGSIPFITSDDIELLKKQQIRPTLAEAADNLIRYLGERSEPLGQLIKLMSDPSLPFRIGVLNQVGLRYLAEELEKKGLLNVEKVPVLKNQPVNADLTFDGWARYEALLRGAHTGRHAFMAMKFGDGELDRVVEDLFKPAIEATGFQARRLDDPEHQRAGLIDDRLRVQINGARFLLVDLTHGNNGAYWEAGYGEGLGKPVIYRCKESVFKSRQGGTHFDTNHHLHILWDSAALDEAAKKLKACIRATIPEAQQES